jgi:hypothetical protein
MLLGEGRHGLQRVLFDREITLIVPGMTLDVYA